MKSLSTFSAMVGASILSLASGVSAGPISTPTYESFESIHVTSGQTATVNVASAMHVKSNGTEYTQTVGSTVTYLIGGSAKVSANKWRIFNVQLGIGALPIMNNGTRSNSITHFENFGAFYSAGVNQYPTKHYTKKDYPLQVPLGSSGLGKFAVQRCNAHMKGLQQQGVSSNAIFNQDRVITIPVAFHFAAQVNDKDKEEESSHEGAGAHGAGTIGLGELYWRQATLWQNVNVVCEKSPDLPLASPKDPTPIPTGSNDLRIPAGVTQSFLTLFTNATPTGACGVKLSGVIETNLANTTVTFAYRNHKGVETPSRSVRTDHTKTVMFVDEIDFSKGKNSGGIVFSTPTGSSGNPADTLASNPSDKQFHGWYQIVGKNFKFKSNMAEYSFNCQPKTPGGLKAPALGHVVLPTANKATSSGLINPRPPVFTQPLMPQTLVIQRATRAPSATTPPVLSPNQRGIPIKR